MRPRPNEVLGWAYIGDIGYVIQGAPLISGWLKMEGAEIDGWRIRSVEIEDISLTEDHYWLCTFRVHKAVGPISYDQSVNVCHVDPSQEALERIAEGLRYDPGIPLPTNAPVHWDV